MSKTVIILKFCPVCWKDKPLDAFSICKSRKDGRQIQCKDCYNKYAKEYIQTEHGREIRRKAGQKYRQAEKGGKLNA